MRNDWPSNAPKRRSVSPTSSRNGLLTSFAERPTASHSTSLKVRRERGRGTIAGFSILRGDHSPKLVGKSLLLVVGKTLRHSRALDRESLCMLPRLQGVMVRHSRQDNQNKADHRIISPHPVPGLLETAVRLKTSFCASAFSSYAVRTQRTSSFIVGRLPVIRMPTR